MTRLIALLLLVVLTAGCMTTYSERRRIEIEKREQAIAKAEREQREALRWEKAKENARAVALDVRANIVGAFGPEDFEARVADLARDDLCPLCQHR